MNYIVFLFLISSGRILSEMHQRIKDHA